MVLKKNKFVTLRWSGGALRIAHLPNLQILKTSRISWTCKSAWPFFALSHSLDYGHY